MNTASYYDAYWNHHANTAANWTPSSGAITPEERRLFNFCLKSDVKCLDYGCGDGLRYGRVLHEAGADYRGFDVSESAVAQARSLGLAASVLNADGTTNLPDGTMDAAICFEVLEHLQEPQKALGEIFRCLRPGGRAMLSVPNAAFWTQRVEFLLTGFWCPGGSPITARKQPWCDPHIRFYHPKLFRRLAESCGFEVAMELGESFTLGATPFIWRRPRLRAFFDRISRPLAWLGRVIPSWFAARIFLVVQKPVTSADRTNA